VIKAAMCRLLLAVYVDRDPFRVMPLPRAYRDLASSSDATDATADSYSGVFPCSSNASDLADVCAYTFSYIASVRGPTKLWKVSGGCGGGEHSQLAQSRGGGESAFPHVHAHQALTFRLALTPKHRRGTGVPNDKAYASAAR
jgi:hypothetical protein